MSRFKEDPAERAMFDRTVATLYDGNALACIALVVGQRDMIGWLLFLNLLGLAAILWLLWRIVLHCRIDTGFGALVDRLLGRGG